MTDTKQNAKQTPLYRKALGSLVGGIIGDAMGTPTEGKSYQQIDQQFGWVDDFEGVGTDDTILKHLLAKALIRTEGYATLDDWAQVWLDDWNAIFGPKVGKFFPSVIHTASKLRKSGATPRTVALGNMPSSSSAMCISPVGIVNACNPRQAALQAYSVAGLIHIHDVGFCQDGAAAMAASVAEAFKPDATLDSVVEASTRYLLKLSGAEVRGMIDRTVGVARKTGEFKAFRKAIYDDSGSFFRSIACDSRETVPLTVALFYLAQGDVEKCVVYGANFGRDADTIASMCGAIAGAFRGTDGIRKDWIDRVYEGTDVNQEELAQQLVQAGLKRLAAEKRAQAALEAIV